MSGIKQRPIDNPFEVKRYNATKESAISQMADFRALWEAYPRMKNYSYLDPAMRRVASWSKEGLLTRGGSLFSIFENSAKVVYDDADNIRHRLYIEDNDLRGTVMRVDYTPGALLGKGRTEFYIWLDVEWFTRYNILLLDSAQYAPVLVTEAEPDGHLWRYTVKLTGDGYIPEDEISIGDMVHQIGSARGEAADERGSVALQMEDNSYIEFSTPKTSFGWEYTVTDKAWKNMRRNNQFYALEPRVGTRYREYDRMITASMLDFKFLAATDKQIDLWMTYGQSAGHYASWHIDGLTNKHLEFGPGFYEWMRYSNIDYFSPQSFSIDYLGNIMTQRWHNNVPPEDRVVDFGTGTLGLKWFQEACREYGISSSLESFEVNNEIAPGGGFDGMHTGVIVNKKQHVGAFLPQFGMIRVHYLPHLDDDKFEKRRYKGYSIRSGEFIALDTGFGNGANSNVYIVKEREGTGFTYGTGLLTPLGSVKNNRSLAGRWTNTEGSKNIYKLIRDEAFTIVVKDPAAIMWLKPAIK